MSKRPLEEVVIALEGKVNKLLSLFSNIDYTNKLLLNQVNQMTQALQTPITEEEQTALSPTAATKIAQKIEALPQEDYSSTPGVMEGTKMGFEPSDFDDAGNPVLQEVTVPKGSRRGDRKPKGGAPRIAVSQKIIFPDGNPLFLGAVVIKDKTGALVKQTRTNSQGRWVAGLSPGEYSVTIFKRGGEGGTEAVDLDYLINVPPSEKPVEFPPPQLELK